MDPVIAAVNVRGKHQERGGTVLSFVPISMEDFVKKYVASNPGSKPAEVRERLKAALKDFEAGVRCRCGNPIWVIGSAEVGRACFTCITGEAMPDRDYEIREACIK
jgi:hypothetical protein